ncbi:MAG TPA: urease accessory protein UreD [Polyangiaceae bacterium]|nr:urease accessory protein UreD [Polyangiaceae bacterium]
MSASMRPAIGRSHAALPSVEATTSQSGRSGPDSAGTARLEFRRRASGGKTVLGTAFAASPLRLLTPANHGDAAWVFLASLGGGLLDGDRIDLDVEVGDGASALLGTQASTKVYRSPPGGAGSSQRLSARVGAGALLAFVPDPVVCFADARYEQTLEISLAPSASLWLADGYSCGRSARGERWAFSRYASRTTVFRGGARSIVDATRLEAGVGPGLGRLDRQDAGELEGSGRSPRPQQTPRIEPGPLADRMGRFDVVLSLLVVGPRFAHAREAILAAWSPGSSRGAPAPLERDHGSGADSSSSAASVLVAASPLGDDACILRVAADRFESASRALRSSFALLASVIGDDPFARKW